MMWEDGNERRDVSSCPHMHPYLSFSPASSNLQAKLLYERYWAVLLAVEGQLSTYLAKSRNSTSAGARIRNVLESAQRVVSESVGRAAKLVVCAPHDARPPALCSPNHRLHYVCCCVSWQKTLLSLSPQDLVRRARPYDSFLLQVSVRQAARQPFVAGERAGCKIAFCSE